MPDHDSQKLMEMAKELSELGKHLKTTDALKEIRRLGLLTGLENLQSQSKFISRLKKNAEHKEHIGQFFVGDPTETNFFSLVEPGIPKFKSLFFESGSTVAFIIGAYAKYLTEIAGSADAVLAKVYLGAVTNTSVVTNNMFALTGLADLVSDVQPIQGSLLNKYYGFFPFRESHNLAGDARVRAYLREFAGYERLSSDINDVNVVFATCSDFSFLAGPLVGSRANALTKHAMYTGRNRDATFVLAFDVDKIVSIDGKPSPKTPNTAFTDCFCVFPPTSSLKAKCEKVPASCGETDWHRGWFDAQEAVSELFQKNAQLGGRLHRNLGKETWLENAAGIKMVIGLPPEKHPSKVDMIRYNIDRARDLVGHLYNVEYRMTSDEKVHKQFGVCVVEAFEIGN